jgi:DNA ligase (NAD+)
VGIKEKISKLSKSLLHHQYIYYVKNQPEISDREYDCLFDELLDLEKKYPQLAVLNSPTKRIGSDLDNSFSEQKHKIPVLSLDKEYTTEGLKKWIDKIRLNAGSDISFVVEEKIDGVSIVLYYKKGLLDIALTRGNGIFGNDVTNNIKTINQVPLIINQPIDVAVRGEIYITKSDFQKYNKNFEGKYSNPRNLAAGSLRNLKSSLVSKIPLNIFAHPNLGFFSDKSDWFFPLKEQFPELVTGTIADISDYIKILSKKRKKLKYEIDGLVIKVNEIPIRNRLGYTSHHPRWSIAFKFDAPVGHTVLNEIRIQIGRNGRVTPVAILKPVKLGGSIVSRATLHNQEYIDMLELGIGDVVSISKRGDVIPAVEEVVEKSIENPSIFKLTKFCPFCQFKLIKDGSHHFCPNRKCSERMKRSLIYFVARDQMDIEGLGEKTIRFLFEKGFIKSISDLFTFDYGSLLGQEGFKEKKIENIRKNIELSKRKPFSRVLFALGFEGLGSNTVLELIKSGYDSIDKIMDTAARNQTEKFSSIEGFGEITARLMIRHFSDPNNIEMIETLKKIGLNFQEHSKSEPEFPMVFSGQIWAITGSFHHFSPRSQAAVEIEKRGGKVSDSISGKTTHLLCGDSPGGKLEKTKNLNIRIVREDEFMEMLI